MACNHEHIRSTNCVLYCLDCGARLPQDFLVKKASEEKPAEKPAARKRVKK